MRKAYPSDVNREQYEIIRYIFENARKKTRPRDYDIYDIFCAILYVLKEACRWRSLPHDFPKWQNVYYHFKNWSVKGEDGKSLLDKAMEELVLSERIISGRKSKTTMSILDSKSVKNAFTAEEKGYDGGKKNIGD
ncbi:MAG: transposase [Chitinispirillales bacterium]|nr:transposase [Chitinispirillales bacterium]